jgi:UPF0716 protein FxsA
MVFIFILLLPFLEVYVFFRLAEEYGWLTMFLVLFGSALFGLFTIKRASLLQTLSSRQPAQMGKQALTLFAGILFLIPGIITDIFGFLLLFPPTRMLIGLWVQTKLLNGFKNGSVKVFQFGMDRFGQNQQNENFRETQSFQLDQDNVIDVTPIAPKRNDEK